MSGIGLRTINDVLAKLVERGAEPAMLWQEPSGEWAPISCEQVYGRVRALADVLQGWGVKPGDRVVILSENRWEWAVADFAVLAIGAVSVPLYATNTAEQVGYMVRDSGARVAFVSSAEQRAKLTDAAVLPELERVVVMNEGEDGSDDSFQALLVGASDMMKRDAKFDAQLQATTPDDLCTIIYTSGTTGEPKGVELTHGNLAANINFSSERLNHVPGDRIVEFLPLSHVYARHVDYLSYGSGTIVAHVAKAEHLASAMKAVKPTEFNGVPRLYEKIRQGVEAKSATSPIKKRILAWALATGSKHRQEILEGRTPGSLAWKLADKLVYSKIREAFGGCVRTFVSGSAALGMDTAGWFADVGIRIFEGYGLTETSPVISVNYPGAHRIGSIGLALPNMDVRLAADGELEVRGPAVFKGYWKKPKETAEVFTEDGWFKTGDIGAQDADGYLSITDRKKEILKTSGGKMIAPQPLENRLKSNVLVGNAAVVGDKHKYVSVLISPNLVALRGWAKGNGLADVTSEDLVRHAKVQQEYERIVAAVNKGLAPYETMKRVAVVADEWGIETGELTSTMKLKRRVVNEKYATVIGDFYKDEAKSRE
jgi:long-chain acyl-CoA synthetase